MGLYLGNYYMGLFVRKRKDRKLHVKAVPLETFYDKGIGREPALCGLSVNGIPSYLGKDAHDCPVCLKKFKCLQIAYELGE